MKVRNCKRTGGASGGSLDLCKTPVFQDSPGQFLLWLTVPVLGESHFSGKPWAVAVEQPTSAIRHHWHLRTELTQLCLTLTRESLCGVPLGILGLRCGAAP